jgi:hypothetical protein
MNENMDVSCFNMAVRILAWHDIQLARDVPVHYMDLNFCVSYYNYILNLFICDSFVAYTNVFYYYYFS